jgi:hypothetical protein
MNPTRPRHALPALFCLLLLIASLLPGCSKSPEEPVFANPFAPGTPGSADPFELRAIYSNGVVTLMWTPLTGFDIAKYVVLWVYQGDNYELARLDPAAGAMTYIVEHPVPNITNYYRIRVLDEYNRPAAESHVVPAQVQVPPIVKLASGQTQVRSRRQNVVVRAAVGDYSQVDTISTFATALQADIGADSTAHFPLVDLGPRPSASARCTLYARAAFDLGGGQPPLWSETDRLVLTIQFNPTIIRPDSSVTVARPWTDLVISNQAAGVQSMRFANSAAGLADATWQPGAPLATDVPLLDTPLPQTVHAEFLSEFGFTRTASLNLRADDLSSATFHIALPVNASGHRIAATPRIPIRNRARATEMRISQLPGFADAPWVPYARDAEILLEGEPGLYLIYAWFRNHWFESAILIDHVIVSGASLEVAFLHPLDGQVVRGGTALEIAGTAATFDPNYPLTLVEVHTGDGWQPAAGTTYWSALWPVPRYNADTQHQLGVRAIASDGDDEHSGIAWITVTVSQLAVRITAPAGGAQVPRGADLVISGTASPFLNGAPLDSVVVAVPGTRLVAPPPLAAWSVTWDVPAGEADEPASLTAWAYAGGDSASHQVEVQLVAAAEGKRRAR